MARIRQKLTWFRKDNDEFVGEAPLKGITVRHLRRLFDGPNDDPMYVCYEVTARHDTTSVSA